MALNGKVAIVSGGSGVVGSGIIGQYLAAGATVIAPLRGSSDSLLKEVEYASAKNLEVVAADVTNEREIAQLARTVEGKYGSVDHIVTVVGGWWQKGPLLQQSYEELLQEYKVRVLSHFTLAKHLLPILKPSPDSSFTFLTGAAGEACYLVDASMITAQIAGLYGVIMCIQAECALRSGGPRINELRIGSIIKRHEDVSNAAYKNDLGSAYGEFSNRAPGKAAVQLALDVQSGNKLLKVAAAELSQLQDK